MPNPDLRKDFLAKKFFSCKDPKKFLTQLRDSANNLRLTHEDKPRSERLMELQNAGVEYCLDRARGTLEEINPARDWNPKRMYAGERVHMADKFNLIYDDYGEPTWRELTQAVAKEVKESLVAWGFRTVTVRAENAVLTSSQVTIAVIHIAGLVKSLLNDTEKNSPAAAASAPSTPAPRTDLIGQCTICLEEKTKLLAFIPCGHTCLRNKYRTMSKRHTNFHQVSFESRTKNVFLVRLCQVFR